MDYKYIEQLLDRYFEGVTTSEEENILRTFFSQKDIPASVRQWQPLFVADDSEEMLGDDFDERILSLIGDADDDAAQKSADSVAVARVVPLRERLAPLFKAAAVVAIVLTIGGALQAPWDSSWNTPADYAAISRDIDTVAAVQPIQAENINDAAADSTFRPTAVLPKD